MNIRDAAAVDGDAIRALVTETLAEFGFPLELMGADADLADIAASYQDRGGTFRVVVAEDGVTIVGCGGLYPIDERVVELRKMYFRPEARGRGLGRDLLIDLIEQAKNGGVERIVLETASNLTAAIRLYQGFGFVESVAPKHACRCDRTFSLTLGESP
jgi:putative acetyltransferase